MAIITFLTLPHPLPLQWEISLSLTSISLPGQAVIVLIVSYSLGPDLLSWPWMMEQSEWGGVYCHPDGPQCGRFAQGPSVASSSPHQYNSWGGTIVWVTDKAFTLDRSGHLSQGDSKETSLSTNGGGKVLCSLFLFLSLFFFLLSPFFLIGLETFYTTKCSEDYSNSKYSSGALTTRIISLYELELQVLFKQKAKTVYNQLTIYTVWNKCGFFGL